MAELLISSILQVDGSTHSLETFKETLSTGSSIETINEKNSHKLLSNTKDIGLFSPAAGFTSLHASALIPYKDVCAILCAHGAKLDEKDIRGRTPARWAAEAAHIDILLLLLAKGADINSVDTSGWTMLHLAAQEGGEDVLSVLLRSGASVNLKAPDGRTAIHFSAESGHDRIVVILLESGANVYETDDLGWTALNYAADQGHVDVCRTLLQTGALFVDDEIFLLAVGSGSRELCELFLVHRANPNSRSESGQFPLLLACERGHTEVCSALLEAGADISVTNSSGFNALWIASRYGYVDICVLLCERGTDINEVLEDSERSALHIAATEGQAEVCVELVSRGGDLAATCGSDKTTPLHLAAANGHADLCLLLISLGADVHAKNRYGMTPLLFAAAHGTTRVCTALLDLGSVDIDIDAFGGFEHGIVAGLYEVKGPTTAITVDASEVENGARLLSSSSSDLLVGFNPLLQAIYNGNYGLATTFLSRGADPNVCDFRGYTPLHLLAVQSLEWQWQVQQSASGIVALLIERGADVDARNGMGQLPDEVAETDEQFVEAMNAAREERQMRLSTLRNAKECNDD